MSLDYNIAIIQGFRVPRNKVEKKTESREDGCKHQFDRENNKFCPECGKHNFYLDTDYECLIDGMDLEKLRDNDDELSNGLKLMTSMTPRSNCEEEEDFILGIKLLDDDPMNMEDEIQKINTVTEKEVLDKIAELKEKIPYDKYSFGIYVLSSIY